MTEQHVHEWEPTLHADGCHFFLWSSKCACGATRTTRQERPLASGDWLDYGDFPNPEGCARCRELQAGAEPQASDEIKEAGDA